MQLRKHKAKLVGGKSKKRYYLSRSLGGYSISPYREEYTPLVIWEGFLDDPVLERGEMIFVNDEIGSVEVFEVQRTVEGGYRYIVNYDKWIEDEETFISKGRVEERLKTREEKGTIIVDPVITPKKNKKWYQFWK